MLCDIGESTRGCDEKKNKNKPCTTGPSRMNIHDFIEAVKIDDAFLQIFAHQWNRALYDVVIAAEEEYRFQQELQPDNNEDDEDDRVFSLRLEDILLEKLKLYFGGGVN